MKRSVKVDLDPAWRAGDILPVVLGAPALHEAQPYRTHLGQLEDGLVAVRDGLRQQRGKVLVVEHTQGAAGRDLADGGRVKAVVAIAVTALDEDA